MLEADVLGISLYRRHFVELVHVQQPVLIETVAKLSPRTHETRGLSDDHENDSGIAPTPSTQLQVEKLKEITLSQHLVKELKFRCLKNFGQTSAAKRSGSLISICVPSSDHPMMESSHTRNKV